MNLLIKNARIATSASVFPGDVLIAGERVACIGTDLPAGGARVIDAAGRYLLPGGVDAHTHFDLDTGAARVSDTFYTGSVAAACGGTTTIVDHLGFGPAGCALSHQVDAYHELARDAVIDYGFHGVIQHVDETVLADMATLIERGITSYKVYLTYGFKVDDAGVIAVLARARELGLVICAHCENDATIAFLTRKLLAEGKGAPRFHPVSRPASCEAEAVFRFLMLARAAGDAPVYVVHLSSIMGLEAIRLARQQGQKNIGVETCPQYLLLDDGKYADDAEGLKYIISPPLRTPADNAVLWDGIAGGDIDVVATDHCPFFFATQKQVGRDDFSRCPGGAPGVETRMPLMFSEGFMAGRLTLPEVVRTCCLNPARRFGLHNRKGDIAPGLDADLVLFDPDVRWTISRSRLHENVDYTPYEGLAAQGAPVLTISRGEVIVENGSFVGKTGRGKYLSRSLPEYGRI